MAQAILLQDVDSLGERGQAVDVAPGYLRNYLIPRKLAEPATRGSIAAAERRAAAAERAAAHATAKAEESAARPPKKQRSCGPSAKRRPPACSARPC